MDGPLNWIELNLNWTELKEWMNELNWIELNW